MATKAKAKKENKRWENIKTTVKEVNDFVLETSEDIVEGMIKSGEQWQGVAMKATKGGLQLTARQQDIVYDALETMKSQFMDGRDRLKKIFFETDKKKK